MRWEEKELGRQLEIRGVPFDMIDAKSQILPLDKSRFSETPRKILVRCVSFYRGLNASTVYEAHGIQTINPVSYSGRLRKQVEDEPVTGGKWSSHTEDHCCLFSGSSYAGGGGNRISMRHEAHRGKAGGDKWFPIRDRETAEAFIEMRESLNDPMQTIFYIQEMIRAAAPGYSMHCGGRRNCCRRVSVLFCETGKLMSRLEPLGTLQGYAELEETVLKTVKVIGKGILGIDSWSGSCRIGGA